MKRLALLILGIGVCLLMLPHNSCARTGHEPFGFQDVVEKARELAEEPFREPKGEVPEFLLKLDYDQWRSIRFRPKKALWRKEGLPFQVQYFHPGFLYNRTVRLHVIEKDGTEREIEFSPDLFDYGPNDLRNKILPGLGFAGFRLHYPLNSKSYYDEVAVFLGASYFRAVGKGQRFGLSARGLAIDTALDSGEEFPFFKEFWLQRPSGSAAQMAVFALLDSPSATGAYRFVIHPGKTTVSEVNATVFLRKRVHKLGIAPLTSMFFFGENTPVRPDDFRPEVHDSDGLLIATGAGEWTWRPLLNPAALLDTSFHLNELKGFGLCQRDWNFDHYQDLEADSQLRPSVWITPTGDWGEGSVELVQIPMEDETHDNIVSFWVPAIRPDPIQPISFSYKMRWLSEGPAEPVGQVVATRTAKAKGQEERKFLVDFAGGKLETLDEDADIEAVVSAGRGKVTEQQLQKNPYTGGWRLVLKVLPDKAGPLEEVLPDRMKNPLELRALLRLGDETLTETWSYVVFP